MSLASDKIREKILIESISNKDLDSFLLLFSEVLEEQYNNIVSTRFNELESGK
ncbi:MAG: hypothetical protein M0R17_00445 [Candidatus Omnitrophica bacterium]|jgi:hypothetical protein|nr:hypothetical protein [Candidatus Omnitrophota bacterium]